jgi:hypothetical protein
MSESLLPPPSNTTDAFLFKGCKVAVGLSWPMRSPFLTYDNADPVEDVPDGLCTALTMTFTVFPEGSEYGGM